MKIVWGSIIDWVLYDKPIRYKTKFKYEHGLLPVNTVLDARFLIMEHDPKEDLEEVFTVVENFYKKDGTGYFTVRSPDGHSIVIVNPFVATGTENQRCLHVAKGISGALFIGKHGENINRFLYNMNCHLVKIGMQRVNKIKLIEIVC